MKYWKQLIISCSVVSLGTFFVYAKQHDRYSFDLAEFIMWLPFTWVLTFTLSLIVGGCILKK